MLKYLELGKKKKKKENSSTVAHFTTVKIPGAFLAFRPQSSATPLSRESSNVASFEQQIIMSEM